MTVCVDEFYESVCGCGYGGLEVCVWVLNCLPACRPIACTLANSPCRAANILRCTLRRILVRARGRTALVSARRWPYGRLPNRPECTPWCPAPLAVSGTNHLLLSRCAVWNFTTEIILDNAYRICHSAIVFVIFCKLISPKCTSAS